MGIMDFLDTVERRKSNLLLISLISLASYVDAYEQKMQIFVR